MELKMKTKIGKSPSYLVRNPYTYCFRMNVPQDLQPYIGRKELRYSLKTGYLSTSKYKARLMAGQVQQIFKLLRKGNSSLMKLSDNQIKEIVQKYLKEYIDSIEERMYSDDPPNFTLDTHLFYQYVKELDDIKQEIVEYLGTLDYRTVAIIVDDLLKENGIDNIDRSSVSYQKLCRGILKAQLKGNDIEKKQMRGEYSDDAPPMRPQELELQITRQESATLSHAAKDYWDEYSHNWKPRTKTDYKIVLDHIVDSLGANTQLHTIDYNTGKRFRDGLKSGKLSKNGKPLSVSRVNFHLDIANTMYNFATKLDKNLDRVNPFQGLRLREKVRADKKQDPFSREDLKKLFCLSPEYGRNKLKHAHHFWIPLISLYTGARLDEICQLLRTDVINRDGYWLLRYKGA